LNEPDPAALSVTLKNVMSAVVDGDAGRRVLNRLPDGLIVSEAETRHRLIRDRVARALGDTILDGEQLPEEVGEVEDREQQHDHEEDHDAGLYEGLPEGRTVSGSSRHRARIYQPALEKVQRFLQGSR
jgi:hypothetical protein